MRSLPVAARRRLLIGAAAAGTLAACSGYRLRGPQHGVIAAMFPGQVDDRGFIEAGYTGLLRIRDEIGIPIRSVANVSPREEAMEATLRELADSDAKMVMACGDETSDAVQRVAWEFPEQRFSVIQGRLTRPNLAIYDVRQEESAWLAGAAAGLLTKTSVVGHIAGARTAAALKARAAFSAGLAFAHPRAVFLTRFSTAHEHAAEAKRVAAAEIDAGADLIYAMLNAGRAGAIEACRERGAKQIGAVRDWVAAMPEVFIASAVADPGIAVLQLGHDVYDSIWKGGLIKRIGVRNAAAVRLTVAASVPEPIKARLTQLTQEMAAGTIKIPDDYTGKEFNV